MKNRLAAVIGIAAVALATTGAVLIGLGYNSAVANPPDDSAAAHVAPVTAVPSPSPTATADSLPLPTEADIPADFTAEQRADALSWLTYSAILDDCMAEAGFPEWTYSIYWQPGFDPHTKPGRWLTEIDPGQQDAATQALRGSTGAGADYHWEDAGCQGYATHAIGADTAN